MKSLKTFNLDIDVIRIVKQKQNQSQYVCKAIRRMHNQEDDFQMFDIETDVLLRTLLSRAGCPIHIKAVIRDYLGE